MGYAVIDDKIFPRPGGTRVPASAVDQRAFQNIGDFQKIMGVGFHILRHLPDLTVKILPLAGQIFQMKLPHNFTPVSGHFRPMAKRPRIRYNADHILLKRSVPPCPFTNSQRFRLFFSRDPAIDRTPVVEWASWWDQTLTRWRGEGLPAADDWGDGVNDYWGQDLLHQFWCPTRGAGLPTPAAHGAPLMLDERDYERIRPALFTDELLEGLDRCIREYLEHSAGRDPVFWFTLDGFFWFPRVLFGIENHLYAFYDYPELMHRVNRDLCDFHKRTLEVIYSLITPQFMTLAEDMSYNLGPMCSREQYDEFLLPYYKELVPLIQAGHQGPHRYRRQRGASDPLVPGWGHRRHPPSGADGGGGCQPHPGAISLLAHDRRL